MSSIPHTLIAYQCRKYDAQELISLIESKDIMLEIKIITKGFIRFLKLNIAQIALIALMNNDHTHEFHVKAMLILTANSREIRKIMTYNDDLTSLLLEFPYINELTSIPAKISTYCSILSQLIMRNEYDFLGKIPSPGKFIKSLIKLAPKLAMFDFLCDFFETSQQTTIHFLEKARLTVLLVVQFEKKPKNAEVYIRLMIKIVCSSLHSAPLLTDITNPGFISTLIKFALNTFDINSSAVAFDLLALLYDEEYLPEESIAVVNEELTNVCSFIIRNEFKPFNIASRCAIDLIEAIVNGILEDQSYEESEDEYQPPFVPLTRQHIEPPMISNNTQDFSNLYLESNNGIPVINLPSLSPPPTLLRQTAVAPPTIERAPLAPLGLNSQRLLPLDVQRLPLDPRAPMEVPRTVSDPRLPLDVQRGAIADEIGRKQRLSLGANPAPRSNNVIPAPKKPFSLAAVGEANANLSLLALVQSCPVFSLPKPGMFTIEEEPDDQPVAPILFDPLARRPPPRRPLRLEAVGDAAASLLRAFFAQPTNTALHNAAVALARRLSAFPGVLARALAESRLAERIEGARAMDRGGACFWGQLHELEGVIRDCPETAEVFWERFREEWEDFESVVNAPVEVPEVDGGPRPLSPD